MDKTMERGIVFDIQKFCINDGPGIRTTVFLKGCTINCAWCHNPESKSFLPQLAYREDKCIACGACEAVCKQKVHTVKDGIHTLNRDACIACGACVEACPTGALSIYGKQMSVDQVIKEVKKDKAYFINSGGGLTLSGGEPLAQPAFALALAQAAQAEGISVAIESALHVNNQILYDIVDYVDWFLIDHKLTNLDDYDQYIGGNPHLILDNLALLNELGANIVLRCPIIPNINDNDEHFARIVQLAQMHTNIDHIELLPYHPMGKSKAKEIGVLYTIEAKIPEDDIVISWIDKIKALGYEKVVQG